MKKIFVYTLIVIVSASCHRRITPQASQPVALPIHVKPLVIVDSHGNILVTEKTLPPGASASILNIKNARGFTPEQINKLAYRFKTIPPKILYVPPSLVKTSSRGTYYVYNKKFWFWKKQDGYFYLDETYYN